MAQIWNRNGGGTRPAAAPRFRVGGVCIPLPGETQSGDGWIFQEDLRGGRITVADGLGHGADAAVASRAAVRTAREQTQSLRAGPAGTDPRRPAPHPRRRRGGGRDGRPGAGGALRRSRKYRRRRRAPSTVPCATWSRTPARPDIRRARSRNSPIRGMPRSLLVMHSDGLISHWSFDAYPGLTLRHPSVIAGVLYRDYMRGQDDVTVVVAQEARPEL